MVGHAVTGVYRLTQTWSKRNSVVRFPLLAVLSLSAPGCYSTWKIAAAEFQKLDGYRGGTARVLVATDGDQVQIDRKTEVRFDEGNSGKLQSIDIQRSSSEDNGAWWLNGVLTDARSIRIDMERVGWVTATRYSPGKTGWSSD
jgi:hypothetical protein